ncbi:hypothetical protein DCAR_0624790 [Daucus carota subsp. sativus]|nr:hypothetical protein DCAR_0624790 [Daucus carota subsp. sativus]
MVYVTLMVVIMVMIMLIMKFMKVYDQEADSVVASSSETDRLLPKETMSYLDYGTCCEQDSVLKNYSSSSSEDLYDENICIICYDNSRNCFFVPCGHCATCCACAKRIVDDGENKNCPICRRLIQKVRKLFTS